MPDPLAASHPVLRLCEVCFFYEPDEKAVVSDFSAALGRGQLCALIGPNAAGKTTLMKLLLGHLQPTSGRVLLQGQPVASLPATVRAAAVSYVPQRGGSSFAFTVEEVVAMGRLSLTAAPQAVERALEQCELQALRRRVFSELSVGQQQRVLLARALCQAQGGGVLMLLDEPGSAMDLKHMHATMALLRQLCASGMTVLVVLHDLNLTAMYADQVWLMREGQLVAAGPWDQVLEPTLLEPVYGMQLKQVVVAGSGRPMFWAGPSATL